MGLCCTSDNWCYKSDKAIAGVPHAFKIVDDILIIGRSVDELMNQIDCVMRRCKQHGIALSHKKFTINNYVRIAGYWISLDGVEPDKHMTDSIDRFPSPKDIHQLRSFLGLANQLGHFLPDLAQNTEKMRALLKKRVIYKLSLIHI